MIPRYTRPEMAAIWDPQTRFRIWFEIEAHAADAMAELGIIPKAAAKTIWDKGRNATFDVARIDAIEREVKHDVIAFLTHLAEIVGPEARFVHSGHDLLRRARHLPQRAARARRRHPRSPMSTSCWPRSSAAPSSTRLTPTIGRSHGIHAEPTTFGLKLA